MPGSPTPNDSLSPDEYAALAHRTENVAYDLIATRLTTPRIRLLHGAMGLCTEAGEIQDLLKRTFFYGKTFDPINLQEELGDALWYIALLCNAMNWSLEQIMQQNIAKLQARYPEQFTVQHAVNRDLSAERTVLERSSDSPL
jgi:NTP pyrophosphatase (non-canonical NTP hydrolase)